MFREQKLVLKSLIGRYCGRHEIDRLLNLTQEDGHFDEAVSVGLERVKGVLSRYGALRKLPHNAWRLHDRDLAKLEEIDASCSEEDVQLQRSFTIFGRPRQAALELVFFAIIDVAVPNCVARQAPFVLKFMEEVVQGRERIHAAGLNCIPS